MGRIALVFGGAGFIGSHLLTYLAATGEYDGLFSADLAEPRFRVPGVNYEQVDVREPIPEHLAPGATEIYNLAAVHTTPGHEDWEYYWTNVLGATHVVDFSRKRAIYNMVFTSSIAVYGPSETLKDEDAPLDAESAYGRSKLAAEKIHSLWQAESPESRRLVIVRPAVIYGYTERGNFTRLAGLLRRRRFVFPGRTDTIKACGYVEDLVGSMRWVLDLGLPATTYNFCHPTRYTMAEICAAFSQVAGYAPANIVMPLYPMLFAGWLFEKAASVGLRTSINRARVMKLVRSNNISPKRLSELGYPYRYNLEESLRKWQNESPTHHFD
ncbi:NAD-dependent epimerase/dehydratase family protein [Xanthobacter flavus]|uniref:NAD-dependent epimerase/dehydratase family protein n=1 Tax=Xanthobacter flavus TaxID=281 RepID=UPI00372AF212